MPRKVPVFSATAGIGARGRRGLKFGAGFGNAVPKH